MPRQAALPPVLDRCYAAANRGSFGDPRKRDGEGRLHPVFDASSRKQGTPSGSSNCT